MLKGYLNTGGHLKSVADLDDFVWVDLIAPSADEQRAVESALAIAIPSREEMQEIEVSSRLFHDDVAAFMTVTVPANAESDDPEMAPVTFILTRNRLATVRYHDLRAFQLFAPLAEKVDLGCDSGEGVLIALLEAIVDRLADVLERATLDVDRLSHTIFRDDDGKPNKSRDLLEVLRRLGRKGDLNSKLRDSLVTFERLIGFLRNLHASAHAGHPSADARLKTLGHDIASLADHSGFLSQKITFLLDATLGLIGIEQNAIIKIVSVAAVVFLPPTLVASIYGMNFNNMPGLDWPLGYPAALALMILSAVLPYAYFKRRGWL